MKKNNTKKEDIIEDVVEETTKKEEKVSKNSVVVVFRNGSREFSKEIHGADFKKLAEQFAEKFNGELV